VEAVAFTIDMPEKINTRSLMSLHEENIFSDITLASGYKASAPVMNRAAAKVSAKADLSAIPAETKGFHSSQRNTRYNPVGLAQKDWNSGSADEPGSVAMGRRQHRIEVRSDRACGKATGKVHDTRRFNNGKP
jgi:hypothetical protein